MNNIMGFIKEKKPTKVSNNSLIVTKDFTHSCAIGQTGCGKTSSYIYPNLEQRIKDKDAILFFDYKGKEHQAVKYFAKEDNRFDDVIEIGKDWGKSINLLKYMSKGDLEDFIKRIGTRSFFVFLLPVLCIPTFITHDRKCYANLGTLSTKTSL